MGSPKLNHPQVDYRQAQAAARFILARWPHPARVGIILGSGLGEVARELRGARKLPYPSIPHFPRPSVPGHSGTIHMGLVGKVPVAVLEGRMHLYEGFSAGQVVFPARVLALAGVEVLIVTCAAGGIGARAAPGSFIVFSDHLNFQGTSPLAGPMDSRWGPRFVDLSEAYDQDLRRAALQAARACRLKFSEGVYAACLGPNYETPAEIRALRRLGADAVGMSTVPEVVAARQMGLRVLAVAAISNRAAGLSRRPLSHEEVLRAGKKSAKDLGRWIKALVTRL